jgi:hypothetical protein
MSRIMVASWRMVISSSLPMLTGPEWGLAARAKMPSIVSSA